MCKVELYELAVVDVYNQERDTIVWPAEIAKKQIHGVMTLYDVGDKATFRLVPETLSASHRLRHHSA